MRMAEIKFVWTKGEVFVNLSKRKIMKIIFSKTII